MMTREHKRLLSYIDREIELGTEISAVVAATSSVIIPTLLGICWLLVGY